MLAELAAVLGAPIYFGAVSLDVTSTRHALEACRTAQARCYEAGPSLNTGQPATAVLVASGLSALDWHIYKRNKRVAWGMRVGVAIGYGFVYAHNRKTARDVSQGRIQNAVR